MNRLLGIALLAASSALALDNARIDEIAAWLPEAPAATGARIGDRAAWDRLAALPSAPSHITAAEKALAAPIPDLPDDLYLEFSQNGNRTHYQVPYFKRLSDLSALLLGVSAAAKERANLVAQLKGSASRRLQHLARAL